MTLTLEDLWPTLEVGQWFWLHHAAEDASGKWSLWQKCEDNTTLLVAYNTLEICTTDYSDGWSFAVDGRRIAVPVDMDTSLRLAAVLALCPDQLPSLLPERP